MKIKLIIGVVFISTILSGCLETISSLHQPYKVENIIEDKNILGNWGAGEDSSSSSSCTFTRSLDSLTSYIMYETIGSKKNIGNYYTATVFKIGNDTFVDFIQNMSIIKIDTLEDEDTVNLREISVRDMNYKGVFHDLTNFPVHTFAKLDYIDDTMRLSFISRDFVQNQAKISRKLKSQIYIQKDSLRDVAIGDAALVFWSTEEIQTFIKKNVKDTSFFGSSLSLVKKDKL